MLSLAGAVPLMPSAQEPPPAAAPAPGVQGPSVDIAWYGENQGLPEVEALKRPVLDAGSKAFKAWTLPMGNAIYSLSGQAAYFRVNGAIRGIYFLGDGEWTYTSSDPVEFPAIRYSLKRHSFVKPKLSGQKLSFQEKIREGIFWFAGGEVPQIPGVESGSLAGTFTARLKECIDQDQSSFLHDLALRILKGTDKPYFRAQVASLRRNWIHVVDPLDWETLSLGITRKGVWSYLRPTVLISRQSSEWSHRVPKPPRFVLTDVDLDLVTEKGTQARLKVTETLVPRVEGLTALDLKLRSRMRGLDLFGKEIIQRTRVTSVRDSQGKSVSFDHSSEGILVALPGLKPNTPVTLSFELEGDLLPYLYYENAWEGWTLGSGAWFPMPLDDAGRVYTVHAQVRAPKKFNLMMGGETLKRVQEGETSLLETRLNRPVRDFLISAKRLSVHEEKSGKTLLRTFGYGQEADNPRLRERTQAVLEFYERLLGPYPFPELNTVVGGSEGSLAPAIITVGAPAQLATENNISAGGYGGSIQFDIVTVEHTSLGLYSIEEIARAVGHQYWAQVVKPWSPEDSWIPEAFSQYCAALSVRRNTEQGRRDFELAMDEHYRQAGLLQEPLSLALAYRVVPEDGDHVESRWQSYLVRSRGACLLHRLNQEIGDEAFVEFLRTTAAMASFQPLTTSQLPVILKAVTGKDLSALFEAHFWDTQMPKRAK
jgi:hypothetical protein